MVCRSMALRHPWRRRAVPLWCSRNQLPCRTRPASPGACRALWWATGRPGARREEEDAPIFAPGEIRGQLGQQNAPQDLAGGTTHPHTTRPGAEHVALEVDLEAVGHA